MYIGDQGPFIVNDESLAPLSEHEITDGFSQVPIHILDENGVNVTKRFISIFESWNLTVDGTTYNIIDENEVLLDAGANVTITPTLTNGILTIEIASTGEGGGGGTEGASIWVQFSSDNSSWHNTLVPATDLYIRFASGVTRPANSSSDWGEGIRFVGAGTGGGEDNVQSDWDEADTTDDAFILNKPNIPIIPTIPDAYDEWILRVNADDYNVDSGEVVELRRGSGIALDFQNLGTQLITTHHALPVFPPPRNVTLTIDFDTGDVNTFGVILTADDPLWYQDVIHDFFFVIYDEDPETLINLSLTDLGVTGHGNIGETIDVFTSNFTVGNTYYMYIYFSSDYINAAGVRSFGATSCPSQILEFELTDGFIGNTVDMVIAFNKATPDLRDVSETAPTEGQALLWKAADSEYQPGDVSVGMSGDGIPDNFSRTEIASFTSSSSRGGVVTVTLSEEIESGHLVEFVLENTGGASQRICIYSI